jgi:hypothetical protein
METPPLRPIIEGVPAPDTRTQERRVRFVAEPLSVPVARRFVTDSVTGSGLADLAEDAGLLVTELSSNAALHSGCRYFDVVVQSSDQAVLIGVEDAGPAVSVTPRPSVLLSLAEWELDELDPFDVLDIEATTGRGLVIVSALADRWGVDETVDGKRVWGELSADRVVGRRRGDAAARSETPSADPAAAPSVPPQPAAPPDWVRVQLVDMPLELARRHDQHLSELVRELQLIEAGRAAWTGDMAVLINELIGRNTGSWRLSQTMVEQGLADGLDAITLDLVMPPDVLGDVQALYDALRLTDELCERDQLLTLASSDDVRRVREWMVAEFVGQIRDEADPLPWSRYDG